MAIQKAGGTGLLRAARNDGGIDANNVLLKWLTWVYGREVFFADMKGTISDSEWKILKLLWRRSPQTLPEILAALNDTGWSNTTIQTFLARLVKKGAIQTERRGKGYLYSPIVSEAECQQSEARAFLERVFDGSVEKMIASFAKGDLSEKEIDRLERMIEGES